jgi:two-component sensor histidine kinase
LLQRGLIGRSLAEALPLQLAGSRAAAAKQVVEKIRAGESLHGVEAEVASPALEDRYFLLGAGPLYDTSERRVGGVLTLTEITERKRAEEKQTILVAELNHRVKNILAVVQSVAWQTLSAAQSLPAFREAFEGRLQAIALAHDVLTERRWSWTGLHDLLERSLAPYRLHGSQSRARWSGPQIMLPSETIVPLAMVLHELSTNAAKYGAFSNDAGQVEIDWELDEVSGAVTFSWRERNGPPLAGDISRGFGSKLITRVLSYDLEGSADFSFQPAGLACTLVFRNKDRGTVRQEGARAVSA